MREIDSGKTMAEVARMYQVSPNRLDNMLPRTIRTNWMSMASAISMSRRGNVFDNAMAESFIKTLKYEEVYRVEYFDLAEAKASIKQFLEKLYNQKRLHSALGYRAPWEFEQSLPRGSRPARGAGA